MVQEMIIWRVSTTVVGEVGLECAMRMSEMKGIRGTKFPADVGGDTYPSLAGRKRLGEDDYSMECKRRLSSQRLHGVLVLMYTQESVASAGIENIRLSAFVLTEEGKGRADLSVRKR